MALQQPLSRERERERCQSNYVRPRAWLDTGGNSMDNGETQRRQSVLCRWVGCKGAARLLGEVAVDREETMIFVGAK